MRTEQERLAEIYRAMAAEDRAPGPVTVASDKALEKRQAELEQRCLTLLRHIVSVQGELDTLTRFSMELEARQVEP